MDVLNCAHRREVGDSLATAAVSRCFGRTRRRRRKSPQRIFYAFYSAQRKPSDQDARRRGLGNDSRHDDAMDEAITDEEPVLIVEDDAAVPQAPKVPRGISQFVLPAA